MPSSAYLLVSHGSRDPRPQVAIDRLASLIQKKIQAPVGTATLECALVPLCEQIWQFSQRVDAPLKIVPLFLLPGVHVTADVPQQVELAQQQLGASPIALSPYLGAHPRLKQLLSKHLVPADAHILLSHGSRRSGANLPVEALAADLNALPAYWSVAPNLETRLQELSHRGCQTIAILPYFLFAGGITDAIAQTIAQLAVRYPHLYLTLADPLSANDELADLIIDLMTIG
ncbi:MAG: sirohydrochlorin chelatase [Leptolyngbyaceae cyanobacterium CSU_1_3]|nr:sirohydrochlorin chelatase [Leptolyngbyaceae cyanobacterium CSU_1_3]